MKSKRIKEAEDTTFITTRGGDTVAVPNMDDKAAKELKKDPDITGIETAKGQKIKEQEGIKFSTKEINSIGIEVAKALSSALEELGEEVVRTSIHDIDETGQRFNILVTFKGNSEDVYTLYVFNEKLFIEGTSTDQEVGEVGVLPSGKAMVSKDILRNNFLKYFKSLYLEAKKADKDYDRDGKIESPEQEYLGSRSKAIKKSMKKEQLLKVLKEVLTRKYNLKEGSIKNVQLSEEDKKVLKKIQETILGEKSDYQKRREAEADYKPAKKDVPPKPFKEPKNDYFTRRKKEMGEDLDVGHQDDEPDMLKSYVYEIIDYSVKLYKQLHKYDKMSAEVDFPNWWQAKVIKARDYISSAQHYLEAEENKPALDIMALENDVNEEGMKVNPGPLKLAGHVKNTPGAYMNPDNGKWFVVVNGKGSYLGPFNSSADATDAEVKYAGLSHSLREESHESGLYVTGRTPEDNTKIKQFLEDSDLYGEWNAREGYWFLPEEEDTYDSLERTLEQEFQPRDINARIEGIFNESKINEQKATCCGRCGRVHVKGTPCKKPYLSKSDPKHCQNR